VEVEVEYIKGKDEDAGVEDAELYCQPLYRTLDLKVFSLGLDVLNRSNFFYSFLNTLGLCLLRPRSGIYVDLILISFIRL